MGSRFGELDCSASPCLGSSFAQNSCSCLERGDTSVSTPEFGMFCNPARAVGSYSSGLSAARAVRTKSMGRFYQGDVSPCKEFERKLFILQFRALYRYSSRSWGMDTEHVAWDASRKLAKTMAP